MQTDYNNEIDGNIIWWFWKDMIDIIFLVECLCRLLYIWVIECNCKTLGNFAFSSHARIYNHYIIATNIASINLSLSVRLNPKDPNTQTRYR